MLSMKEVGPMEFAKAVQCLHTVNETTGAKWMKFVDENSLEIQRRGSELARDFVLVVWHPMIRRMLVNTIVRR